MYSFPVFSSSHSPTANGNLPLPDANRQDNKTLACTIPYYIQHSKAHLLSVCICSLVDVTLLSSGCQREPLPERREPSFCTLTVFFKWSALTRLLPKWWKMFSTKVTPRPSPQKENKMNVGLILGTAGGVTGKAGHSAGRNLRAFFTFQRSIHVGIVYKELITCRTKSSQQNIQEISN